MSLGRKTTRLVSLHTHLTSMGIFLSLMAWRKLIQKSGRQNSPMLLLTFLFSLFFFPFGPHSFIIIATEFLLAASSLVLQQRNCHFEHLFLSLADNSSHTSKPSQMPPCLFSENVRGNHPAPSDPSPAAEACHLHLSLTLDLPTSHSLPTYLPTHTWIDLLTKPPAYHFHPTFTLTCTTLIQAFFKSSKIMSSEKRKK